MNERRDIELIDGERYALNTNKGVREIELHILRNGKLVGEFNGGQIVDLGVGARLDGDLAPTLWMPLPSEP